MAEVVLCCGRVGSGKTTFARTLVRDRGFWAFSLDGWMDHFFGEPADREVFDRRRDLCRRMIEQQALGLLARGIDVVLDSGFWTRAERTAARGLFEGAGARVTLVVFEARGEAQARNLRDRQASEDPGPYRFDQAAVEALNALFEEPGPEERPVRPEAYHPAPLPGPGQGTAAVLGFGTIGRLITDQLVLGGKTASLRIANRDPGRIPAAGALPKGVRAAPGFGEAVRGASTVFLCVSPAACAGVLREAAPSADPHTVLVSAAADVTREQLASLWPGPVVRIMPTVTSSAGRGVTLVCPPPGAGHLVDRVAGLFPGTAEFLTVDEARWNAVTAVTSCGPGLLAAMLREFGLEGTRRTGMPEAQAEELTAETMAGVLALRDQTGLGLGAILDRVATPGGVTGEGARILREELPPVLGRMHEAMESRHQARSRAVAQQFAEPESPGG